ncbi:hypothetical protein EOD41_09025 [Mucilaginibacter limnophilus]|uniref:Uncharacterized protein n=1 Tax=Mucilaginibacter limnophilus TaxID=1932778 RepID=A0A3S2Y4W0_9SPHI|nr:hypothetical protein [Mucilaginibacter limnophilus]RVU02080.1 hypothetical protein EOD41_09025 [Mucilaginibacter limnophilus]
MLPNDGTGTTLDLNVLRLIEVTRQFETRYASRHDILKRCINFYPSPFSIHTDNVFNPICSNMILIRRLSNDRFVGRFGLLQLYLT